MRHNVSAILEVIIIIFLIIVLALMAPHIAKVIGAEAAQTITKVWLWTNNAS
jgi:hypothetical protein